MGRRQVFEGQVAAYTRGVGAPVALSGGPGEQRSEGLLRISCTVEAGVEALCTKYEDPAEANKTAAGSKIKSFIQI